MDTIISIKGHGFGITAVDTLSVNSILINKSNLNKFIEIGKNTFLAVSGYPGDVIQFTDFIQKTVQLYTLKTGNILSTRSIANCIRNELSKSLRKSPLNINLVVILSSFLDRYYRPDMTKKEILKLLKECKRLLKTRFIISQSGLLLNLVDTNGCFSIGLI
jgi:20S proteasome subunit beta 4